MLELVATERTYVLNMRRALQTYVVPRAVGTKGEPHTQLRRPHTP